jgi:biopolymer transport protein ExbD
MNSRLLAIALALTLSATATSGEPAAPRDVRLVVTRSGQYILAGRPVALARLRAELRRLKSSGGPIDLHVKGGPDVPYRFIAPAMQIVQEEGLAKVGFLMSPSAEPASAASSPAR